MAIVVCTRQSTRRDHADPSPQAIGQLCSTASMAENLGLAKTLIEKAAKAGAKVRGECACCELF